MPAGIIYCSMVYDLHNDLPTAGTDERGMRAAACGYAVRGLIFAVWTTDAASPTEAAARAVRLTDGLPYPAGIGIEDCGFMARDGFDLLDIPRLRYCSLTWNGDNAFAGGALGSGRLTAAGRRLIEALIARGVALDLAHLNEKSFYDAIDCCGGRARLLCSHTALKRLMKHPRNLTDLQIKTLVSAGGIVGLAAVRAFLNRDEADIAAYAAHIVEYAETFGAASLAIGTDFYGAPPLAGLEGYEQFINLRERLSRHLTSRQIDAILYGNAEKFFNGSDP